MEPAAESQAAAADDPLPELFAANEWKSLSATLRLSPRQAQVARLICLGLSKDQMAKRLRISEPTARLHVKELFRKLRINDRVGVPVRLVVAGRTLGVRRPACGDGRPYPNG